jgi:hypothetical protein
VIQGEVLFVVNNGLVDGVNVGRIGGEDSRFEIISNSIKSSVWVIGLPNKQRGFTEETVDT